MFEGWKQKLIHKWSGSYSPVSAKNTSKISHPGLRKKRTKPAKLEQLYYQEAAVYNACNIYGYFISRGMKIVSKKKEWKELIDDFWEKNNMDQQVNVIGRLTPLFGWCPGEIVYGEGEDKEKAVGFEIINPKEFDYLQDSMGNIKFDPETREPLGYQQVLGLMNRKKLKFPPQSSKDTGWKEHKDREKEDMVVLFLWNSIDGLYGCGIGEVMNNIVDQRRQILDSIGKWLERHGYQRFDITIGNDKVKPTQAKLDEAADEVFNDLNSQQEIVHGPFVALKDLPAGEIRNPQQAVEIYDKELLLATGIPKTIFFGMGEGGTRASDDKQQENWVTVIETIQAQISEKFEDQLFTKILLGKNAIDKDGKKHEDFPRLEFDPVISQGAEMKLREEEVDLREGVRSPDEVRATRKDMEGPAPGKPMPAFNPFSQKMPDGKQPQNQGNDEVTFNLQIRPEFSTEVLALQGAYEQELLKLFDNIKESIAGKIGQKKLLSLNPDNLDDMLKLSEEELEVFLSKGNVLAASKVESTATATITWLTVNFPDLEIRSTFNQVDKQAFKFFIENGVQDIKGTTEQMRNEIKNQISLGMLNGESEREIADRISSGLRAPRHRLATIARTELKRVHDEVSIQRYKDAGIRKLTWLTARDDKVRLTHIEMDGRVWPASSPNIPRDILAEPNCRCVLVPFVDPKTGAA